MKKTIASLICLLSIPIALAATPHKSSSIEIGFIAPLTGAYAEWGNRLKNGFLLALDDTKNQFKPDIHDGGNCEPRKAVSAAQKLLSHDKIKIIVGPGCLSNLKAIASIASQHGAVLFSTGLLDDDAIRNSSNVISWATEISVESKYLAKYIASKRFESIAVVHSADAFGEEFRNRLPEALSSNGVEASPIERVLLEDSDFRSLISRLTRSKPDAIFLNLGESQLATFAKQLRSVGSEIPLFSGYPAESDTTLKIGGAAVEGLTYTYQLTGQEDSEARVRFDRAYKKRFGEDASPSASSYFVYDGMMQLDKALEICAATDSKCLLSHFHKLGTVNGISGLMKYAPDGSNQRPYGIKRIEKGEFIWISKNIDL